jgi:hypothetical protein
MYLTLLILLGTLSLCSGCVTGLVLGALGRAYIDNEDLFDQDLFEDLYYPIQNY